jgi:hypothetical protein
MDSNIVVVRLAPGFDDSMLYSMVMETPHLHGIVLSLYGTGNGPASKQSFIDLIKVRYGGVACAYALTRPSCVFNTFYWVSALHFCFRWQVARNHTHAPPCLPHPPFAFVGRAS